ncbi:MAG: ABC transporter permease [Bacteroidales bacterium]|nr:ABC transporter permease [Bacteroidales bacterium]
MSLRSIKNVIGRELDIWKARPVFYIAPIAIMAFCSVFYLTFLRDGLPHDLPIGVVDYDNSAISRNFTRQLDATQLGEVKRFGTYEQARDEMQKGKLTSVCLIPDGFNADLQASRQPKITVYINGLYFVGGALSYQDLLTMIYLTSGAVQKQVLEAKGLSSQQMQGLLRPVNIDLHKIGNPLTSYNACLSTKMLPGTLAMVIVLILIYSLGTELKYGKSAELLEVADGSIASAVGGKIALYTVFFTILGFLVEILLYGVMHFQLKGSIWAMLLDMFLLILASEAAALFIIELIPTCRFAMSIGAIFSVLALSFTGFTLPVEVMPRILQGFAYIFPLRHYYLFEVQTSIFGSGFAGWWPQVLWLISFLILPIIFLPRLKNAYIRQDNPLD